MKLRRFMQHIREQNWFAVGLDVIVVIVGIFLGLQVQAWYEYQEDRVDEINYLERMLEDADNSIEFQTSQLETLNEGRKNREEFLKLLDAKAFSADNLETSSHFYSVGYSTLLTLVYYEDTLEELISTGNLAIISSDDFKNKIARFRAEIERSRRIIEIITTHLSRNVTQLVVLIPRHYSTNMILISPDELNNNRDLHARLAAQERSHEIIYNSNMRTYELSKAFRDEIAAELESLQ